MEWKKQMTRVGKALLASVLLTAILLFVMALILYKASLSGLAEHVMVILIYLLACLAGFVATYAIGIVYKYMILNFYANTPATLAVVFLSCFPLDMPGDLVLCLLAAGLGLRLRKAGLYAE